MLGKMARQDGRRPGDVIRATDGSVALSHPRCARLALMRAVSKPNRLSEHSCTLSITDDAQQAHIYQLTSVN